MSHDFSGLSKEEQLRAENDFLKMKLMLQHGAEFDERERHELPPELENEFLNHVADFEKQYAEAKRIRLVEKLGQPTQFLPAERIPDDEIDISWQKLSTFLNQNGFELSACSPRVSSRELYRFTLEELFEEEVDDINIPGMISGFIYDEFHPDPVYESENVVERFFRSVFTQEPLDQYFFSFHHSGILANSHFYENPDTLKESFNQFKSTFSSIELVEVGMSQKELLPSSLVLIKGNYSAKASKEFVQETVGGSFSFLCAPDYYKCWNIKEITIEGIKLDQ